MNVMIFCNFFFTATATTDIYTPVHTLSLHDALPISRGLLPVTGTRAPASPQPGCAGPTARDIASRHPGGGYPHEAVHPPPDRRRCRRRRPRGAGGRALVPRGRLPRGPALPHTGRARERAHPPGDRSPDVATGRGLYRRPLRRVRPPRASHGRGDRRVANPAASRVRCVVRPRGAGAR